MVAYRALQLGGNLVENPPMSLEQGQRRADIQGLRAVAVLLVVAFHAGLPVPGGFSGVDVFFAISGFVITGTLLRELTSAGRIDLPRFYVRRIRRLLPALALMVTSVAVLGTLASPLATQRTGALTGIAASVFAANVYLYQLPTGYFDVSATLDPLLHTWTLAVEEQFYLVFPALLILGWACTRGRSERGRRLGTAAIVAAVSVVSYVLAVKLAGGWAPGGLDSPESFGFYGSPTRAWEFGLGSARRAGGAVAREAAGALCCDCRWRRPRCDCPDRVRDSRDLGRSQGRRPRRRRNLRDSARGSGRSRAGHSAARDGSRRLGRKSLVQLVSLALAADRLRAGAVAGRHRGRDRRRGRLARAGVALVPLRRESDPLQPSVPGPVGARAWRRRASPCPSGLRRCSSGSTTCCCAALPSRPGRRHGCSMRIRRAAAVPRSKNRACGRPKRGVG